MKFYVAGKWEDRILVRFWHRVLKGKGHEITCDWTDHEYPGEGQQHLLAGYAMADIKGVRDCDVLIALFQEPRHYRGTLVEIGGALALGKPVWVLGPEERSCIFMEHPLVVTMANEVELLSKIESLEVSA